MYRLGWIRGCSFCVRARSKREGGLVVSLLLNGWDQDEKGKMEKQKRRRWRWRWSMNEGETMEKGL